MCCIYDYIIVNENMLFKSKNGSLFEYVCEQLKKSYKNVVEYGIFF